MNKVIRALGGALQRRWMSANEIIYPYGYEAGRCNVGRSGQIRFYICTGMSQGGAT